MTINLIPQSLAYVLLAGLPPEAGIYASILPIVPCAAFGTSRALAVGPVAVVSLMTAAAVGKVADQGTIGYAAAALTLAFLPGGILLAMGLFQLGFVANLLSHAVVAGFITASGILIAASQLKSLLGVKAEGDTLPELIPSILPPMTLPDLSPAMLADLAIPALLISIIGFVESISVTQTPAANGRQRIDPNQEFIGFGTTNLGAATPAAGAFTAVGLALAAIALTPLIHHLPKACWPPPLSLPSLV